MRANMLAVGDPVQALDGKFGWYDAVIVGERGEGEAREVKVHYDGYKKSQDKWLPATRKRVRGEEEELEDVLWPRCSTRCRRW